MSRLKDIKHKQKRTDMYLNLLRQKRRVKRGFEAVFYQFLAKNERKKTT